MKKERVEMNFCRCLYRLVVDVVIVTVVLLVLIAFIPGIPPDAEFKPYKVEPSRQLEGPLAPNDKLDLAERMLDGHIVGPESIAVRGPNDIYVGLHGGKILRIWGDNFDHFKVAASIGPGCAGLWEEEICGRPLGLRFAPNGKLLVADAYLGIFSVDVDTGEKELLVNSSVPIDGKIPLFIDDLDIDSAGNIYWSDASTVASLFRGSLEMLVDHTARLVKYDPKTKTNLVLLNDLHFANGVQLSPRQDFVLVSETVRSRVIRFWLMGPNAGKHDVFVDRLPGMPDNIRAKPGGGYYISLVVVKNEDKYNIMEAISGKPLLRKLLARTLSLTAVVLNRIHQLVSTEFTGMMNYWVLNVGPVTKMMNGKKGMVIEVDEDGQITDSLQGNSGNVCFISETAQVGNNLIFGSPFNKYLARLSLTALKQADREASIEDKPGKGKTADEKKPDRAKEEL